MQYLDTLTAHTHTHTRSGPSVLSGSARYLLLSQSFFFSFSFCSSVNYTYRCLISQYYCALSCIHGHWPLFITAHAGLTCGADRGHNFHHYFALHLISLTHTRFTARKSVSECVFVCLRVDRDFFLCTSDMRSLASTKLVQTSHCDDVREWLMHDKTETGGAVCACVRACVCVYEHVSKVGCGFYATSYTKWNSKPANRFPKPKPIGWDMQWWLLKMKQSLYIFVYRKYDYKVYTYFCSFLWTFILDVRCP